MKLAVLQPFMPKEAGKDFPPAVMHDDGSIEYLKRAEDWEPPQPPDGYERDSTDQWLFRPLWSQCNERHWGTRTKPCGCVEVFGVCQSKALSTYGQRVNFEACNACPLKTGRPLEVSKQEPCKGCPDPAAPILPALPELPPPINAIAMKFPTMFSSPRYGQAEHPLAALRFSMPLDTVQRFYSRPTFHPDGSIEYPRLQNASLPPDEIEGYKRADDNPWRFIPIWPDCILRYQGAELKENGCIQVRMVCQHPDAAKFGRQVVCQDCDNCPVRKAFKPPQ